MFGFTEACAGTQDFPFIFGRGIEDLIVNEVLDNTNFSAKFFVGTNFDNPKTGNSDGFYARISAAGSIQFFISYSTSPLDPSNSMDDEITTGAFDADGHFLIGGRSVERTSGNITVQTELFIMKVNKTNGDFLGKTVFKGTTNSTISKVLGTNVSGIAFVLINIIDGNPDYSSYQKRVSVVRLNVVTGVIEKQKYLRLKVSNSSSYDVYG